MYVDDILVVGNDDCSVNNFKKALQAAFKVCDLGPVKYFLGYEIARNETGILLINGSMHQNYLKMHGYLDANMFCIFGYDSDYFRV